MLKPFTNEGVLEAGLDEAGRGPMFGPVYKPVYCQDDSFDHSLIRDSKKLSKKKRLCFDYIKIAVDFAIVSYDHDKIDKMNIHKLHTQQYDAVKVIITSRTFISRWSYFNNHTSNPISILVIKVEMIYIHQLERLQY